MNRLEKTERELQLEKKRLKEAGDEVLSWLKTTSPQKFASENPWLVAGLAAGVGFFLGYWTSGRRQD